MKKKNAKTFILKIILNYVNIEYIPLLVRIF